MKRLYKRLVWRLQMWRIRRQTWPPAHHHKAPTFSKVEMEALLVSLRQHPGFQYLLACCENARANCEAEQHHLITSISDKVRSDHLARRLIKLQEGIYIWGWLENRVLLAEKALIHHKPVTDEQLQER